MNSPFAIALVIFAKGGGTTGGALDATRNVRAKNSQYSSSLSHAHDVEKLGAGGGEEAIFAGRRSLPSACPLMTAIRQFLSSEPSRQAAACTAAACGHARLELRLRRLHCEPPV